MRHKHHDSREREKRVTGGMNPIVRILVLRVALHLVFEIVLALFLGFCGLTMFLFSVVWRVVVGVVRVVLLRIVMVVM